LPKDVVHVSWAVFLCPPLYLFLPSLLPSSYYAETAAAGPSHHVVSGSSSSVGVLGRGSMVVVHCPVVVVVCVGCGVGCGGVITFVVVIILSMIRNIYIYIYKCIS
jgi:hypothetical protein